MAVVRSWTELSLPKTLGSITNNVLFPLLASQKVKRAGTTECTDISRASNNLNDKPYTNTNLFFVCVGTGNQTQDIMLARQALCH